MKKIFIVVTVLVFQPVFTTDTKTTGLRSQDALTLEPWPTELLIKEDDVIRLEIAKINDHFAASGGYRSSARRLAISQLLKSIGTPVSYKIYKDMVASGEICA